MVTFTNEQTWTASSPKEMVAHSKAELEATPKWRIFKRRELERDIEFWSQQ